MSFRTNLLAAALSGLVSLPAALPAEATPLAAGAPAQPALEEVSQALRGLLGDPAASGEATGPDAQATQEDAVRTGSREALRRFYENRNYAPAWVAGTAFDGLAAALAAAKDDGLDCSLPHRAETVASGQSPARHAAQRDLALTRLALRCATALASGRVDPGTIETDWAIAAPSFDAAGGLEHALRAGNVAAWFAALPPQHPYYLALKEALARYRALAEAGDWPIVSAGDPLKPGMIDERVEELRRRLVAEGDLAPGAASGTEYDAVLEEAVKHFQTRHGISVDSTVGPRTLAALNVPVKARIEQIALNLERWRSLPRDLGPSYILVNVPAASLVVVEDGGPALAMKAVVGDKDHPTPVLQTSTAAVVINPFWRIPYSIYTKEIRPKLRSDPDYLVKNEMVYGESGGLQQLPGTKNALGRIKFETPNRFDVYLHDTPSRSTFARAARAQSHGCVRVERARDLAAFMLQPLAWTLADIDRAVDKGETRRVELKKRWRVHLLYATSFVDAAGVVNFRDDIYGRDRRLRLALAAHAQPSRAAEADKAKPGAKVEVAAQAH